MKITFVVADADLSGGCRVIALHARHLRAMGHQVAVVAPAPWSPSLRQRARAWLGRGAWPRSRSPDVSHFELQGVPVHRLARRGPVRASDVPEADVLVSTWWETAVWTAEFERRRGAKAHFVQGWERHIEGMPAEAVDDALRLPSHKLVVSRFLRDVVAQVAGDRDVTLVPNAIDPQQFDGPPRGKQARPTAGLVYATAHAKGLDVALDALARVHAACPSLVVKSFGAEPERAELPLPPFASLEVRPAQHRLAGLYGSADVWLSASRLEGFGLPALEAMACRTPLVSTRYGGPMDFVRDGENGFLVDVDDAAGLAERALQVLRLPEPEWRRMSDAAHATGHALTWAQSARLFEKGLVRALERA
jgi:glycosyltransferase involved in cell wall biosynthesis